MERNHFLLTQRFLTCAAILLLTILPITVNTTQTISVYRLLDIGQFMIPLLIGFFTSMHFFIDIYMFGYLTKSMSKRGTVAPFGRTILVFGSLSCHILIFLFIKIGNFNGSAVVVIFIPIFAVLLSLALTDYFHQFLKEAKWALYLMRLGYSVLVLLLIVCTIGCNLIVPYKLAIEIAAVVLSTLCACSISATIYLWLQHYRIQNMSAMQANGLDLNAPDNHCCMAIIVSLHAIYSIGVILYSLALIYPGFLNVERISIMATYLNPICVYVVLQQEGLKSRLHLYKTQARLYVHYLQYTH